LDDIFSPLPLTSAGLAEVDVKTIEAAADASSRVEMGQTQPEEEKWTDVQT
jgi:hypothetical protein